MRSGCEQDLTHAEDAGVCQGCAEPYAGAPRPTTRSSTAICIIWKRRRQNPLPTVWPNMTYSSFRISSPRRSPAERHIIPTVLIFRLDIRRMSSRRWIFRMSYRRCIPPVLYFHAFLGEKLPDWKAAAALVRKIAENYTLAVLYHVAHLFYLYGTWVFIRRTVHLPDTAARRQRSTAVSQDITVRCRTGMMVRPRSSRSERFTT